MIHFKDGLFHVTGEEFPYETVQDAVLVGFFGFCGCADPDGALQLIHDALRVLTEAPEWKANDQNWTNAYAKYKNAKLAIFKTDGIETFVLYVLDKKGLVEHGGSVFGSWLTNDGQLLLDLLNEHNV
jgi:hypothetical protein